MFELTMLPAADGDCLVLSYGEAGAVRHILIDGGRTSVYPDLKAVLAGFRQRCQPVDLLVLSHIDADHIEAFLKLSEDEEASAGITEVWYNGFDQLATLQPMGPGQGDRFSDAICKRGFKLNTPFSGGTAMLPDPAAPLSIELASGLRIMLLSPDRKRISRLRAEWGEWRTEQAKKPIQQESPEATGVVAMGRRPLPAVLDVDRLAAAPEIADVETPNGSSIAFVAEWKGRRVLLAADAHPDLLASMIAPLAEREGGRYRIDLFKVSHHGSAKNTTRSLLDLISCSRFAISTDGSRHGHPDPETVARLIACAPPDELVLYFNYRQPRTLAWDNPALKKKHGFRCEFPPRGSRAIAIAI